VSRIRVFIAICSVALGAAGTQAQMPNRQSGFPSQEQFELVRMWKLVETLEIDEGQAAKVFPAFSRHSRQRRALQADHGELLKGLGKSLQDGADDADLLEAIGKIRARSGAGGVVRNRAKRPADTTATGADAAVRRQLPQRPARCRAPHAHGWRTARRGGAPAMERGLRPPPAATATRPR
jgi:hypothetical protein